MYTAKDFGAELKLMLEQKLPLEKIGANCFNIYSTKIDVEDDYLNNLALGLQTLELGAEFAISYEELENIADALIRGEKVEL